MQTAYKCRQQLTVFVSLGRVLIVVSYCSGKQFEGLDHIKRGWKWFCDPNWFTLQSDLAPCGQSSVDKFFWLAACSCSGPPALLESDNQNFLLCCQQKLGLPSRCSAPCANLPFYHFMQLLKSVFLTNNIVLVLPIELYQLLRLHTKLGSIVYYFTQSGFRSNCRSLEKVPKTTM